MTAFSNRSGLVGALWIWTLAGCGERSPVVSPSLVGPSPASSGASVGSDASVLTALVADAASTVRSSDAGSAIPLNLDAKRVRLASPDLRAWIQARMEAGAKGTLQTVRIPIARQGKGWGCICPPTYVGVNPMMAQGPWLDLIPAKGVRALKQGEVVWAEGAFGNPLKHVRYNDGEEPIEYELVPFHVSKISPMPKDVDEDQVELERL